MFSMNTKTLKLCLKCVTKIGKNLLEYCDVYAVGLRSRRYLVRLDKQQRKKALLGNDWPLNNVKAVFPTGSGPRLYNQEKRL
jgi:hypothetical protein